MLSTNPSGLHCRGRPGEAGSVGMRVHETPTRIAVLRVGGCRSVGEHRVRQRRVRHIDTDDICGAHVRGIRMGAHGDRRRNDAGSDPGSGVGAVHRAAGGPVRISADAGDRRCRDRAGLRVPVVDANADGVLYRLHSFPYRRSGRSQDRRDGGRREMVPAVPGTSHGVGVPAGDNGRDCAGADDAVGDRPVGMALGVADAGRADVRAGRYPVRAVGAPPAGGLGFGRRRRTRARCRRWRWSKLRTGRCRRNGRRRR